MGGWSFVVEELAPNTEGSTCAVEGVVSLPVDASAGVVARSIGEPHSAQNR